MDFKAEVFKSVKERKAHLARELANARKVEKRVDLIMSLLPDLQLQNDAKVDVYFWHYPDINVHIPWDAAEADRIINLLLHAGWKMYEESYKPDKTTLEREFKFQHPTLRWMEEFRVIMVANVEPMPGQKCILEYVGEEKVVKLQPKYKVHCGDLLKRFNEMLDDEFAGAMNDDLIQAYQMAGNLIVSIDKGVFPKILNEYDCQVDELYLSGYIEDPVGVWNKPFEFGGQDYHFIVDNFHPTNPDFSWQCSAGSQSGVFATVEEAVRFVNGVECAIRNPRMDEDIVNPVYPEDAFIVHTEVKNRVLNKVMGVLFDHNLSWLAYDLEAVVKEAVH